MRRISGNLLAAFSVTLALGLGACGETGPGITVPEPPADLPRVAAGERGDLPYDVEIGAVGRNARRVYILRPADPQRRDGPVVLFLHGYGSATVAGYERWLAHLVRQGATVLFPAYQRRPYGDRRLARESLDNIVSGLPAALERVRVPEAGLTVAGVSAGGALAVDYATSAKALGLPPAKAVYSVYPGRGLPGGAVVVPAAEGSPPADTEMVAVASPLDEVAGTAWARELLNDAVDVPAGRKRLVIVRDPKVGAHSAPALTTREARRTFWAPLDRLVFGPDASGG